MFDFTSRNGKEASPIKSHHCDCLCNKDDANSYAYNEGKLHVASTLNKELQENKKAESG